MSCDVSVVIPLYNTEKFIRQCVDSVLAQSLHNLEVIVVNDCSTDNGPALCKELYGHDKRVRIIHHEVNQGPAAARDTGTLYAEGKYICYFDSDDEIMPDYISDMFSTAIEYDADVVHSTRCFSIMPKEGEALPLEMLGLKDDSLISFSPDRNELTELTLISDDPASRLKDWEDHRYHFSVWSSLYKTSFLRENNITFNKMRFIAEDAVFYFQCLFKAKRFVVRPGGGYLYRVSDTSLSRNRKSPESAVKAVRAQMDVVKNMLRITRDMPFFMDNVDNTRRAIDAILLSIEDGFVKPVFQSLGEEEMRSGGTVHDFFAENFGEKAPYVEFLFYELHKIYPHVIDYVGASSDPEEARKLIKK